LVCRLIHKKYGQEDAGAMLHVLRGVLEEWSPVMCAKLQFGNHDVQTVEVTEEQEIVIDEFDQEITEHFIFFLYNGRVDCESMPILLELARMAGYYDVLELKKLCMYYLSSIYFANPETRLPSVQEFQSASFELRDLLTLGCHPRMLVACGFSFGQFMEAQATHACLRRAGFSAEQLKEAGNWTPTEAVVVFLGSGCTRVASIERMARLGFSTTELIESGWNSERFQRELPPGSAMMLSECGYGHNALLELGYSMRLLQKSGLVHP